MQKKLYFAVGLLLYPLVISPHLGLAASPSPSPTQTELAIDEVTDNLKKRLQDNLGSAGETKLGATAYIGVVKDIIQDNVIIEDKDGKKDIKITDDTTILRSPGNKSIKLANILLGDYIIAMGYKEQGDNLAGKRLILSTTAFKAPAKISGHGTITAIKKSSLELEQGGETKEIFFTSKTILKSSTGTIELTNLELGDQIIYTATLDDDNDLPADQADQTATIIMQLSSTPVSQ